MIRPLRAIAAFATVLAWAGPLAAAPQAAEPAQEETEIVPPKPIYKVNPSHPKVLYDRGVAGEAVVIASVDMFGAVVDPMVERATHDEFGLAAMLALSEWIFEPATKNGVPIGVKVKIPFEFDLTFEHQFNVEMGRKVFQQLDVPVIPSFELDQAPLPAFVPAFVDFYPREFRNSGQSAAVSLEFIIDPKGEVINPRVISISRKGFEEAAIRAVAHMKYNPIPVDGEAAYISMMMPVQLTE